MKEMTVDQDTVVGGRLDVPLEPKTEDKKYRHAHIDTRNLNEDDRTIQLAFSSESPVEREFGYEVLSHDEGAIDLAFLRSTTAPLLLDHDPKRQIGVVEDVAVGGDKVARARVRFGRSELASEIFNDVQDRIRSNVSVGYRINDLKKRKAEDDEGLDTYIAERWTPLELSIVSIPADQSVGVGRNLEKSIQPKIVE